MTTGCRKPISLPDDQELQTQQSPKPDPEQGLQTQQSPKPDPEQKLQTQQSPKPDPEQELQTQQSPKPDTEQELQTQQSPKPSPEPPTEPAPPDDKTTMPDQSYVGMWIAEDELDDIIISKIEGDTIKFEVTLYRLVGIYATAKIENNVINFYGNTSPNNNGHLINGRITFNENGITLKVLTSEFEYIIAGTVYTFPYKAD